MAITATTGTTSSQALDLSSGQTYDARTVGGGTTQKNGKLAGSQALATIQGTVGVVTVQVGGDPNLRSYSFGETAQPATQASVQNRPNQGATKTQETGGGGTKVVVGDDSAGSALELRNTINEEVDGANVTLSEAIKIRNTVREEGLDPDRAFEYVQAMREEKAAMKEDSSSMRPEAGAPEGEDEGPAIEA